MGKLNYEKELLDDEELSYDELFLRVKQYEVSSLYFQEDKRNPSLDLKMNFLRLKSSIVDLDEAIVTKCIKGTEQDFIMLRNKADDFLKTQKHINDAGRYLLLDMFKECVFGYYVLTPLIKASDVSDIKIYAWNKITCKSNGKRYATNLSFYSEKDYNDWLKRMMRIHNLDLNAPLQRCTDRKGVDDFYLRIDVQLNNVTSTDNFNFHIRKIPKVKYTWQYLFEKNMLDEEMLSYIKDRIASGYSFLLSGRGGSGKTSLLNNMLDIIPFSESVLVSQESDELYSDVHPQMQFEHILKYESNGKKYEVTLEDELELGLLQDIDGFVIGEIKGGEALHVFTTAANTGAWFMATTHSNNARKSVRRLSQCARFVCDYSVATLEEMLADVKISLIHMSGFSIDEIVEVRGWDEKEEELIYHTVYEKYPSRKRKKEVA